MISLITSAVLGLSVLGGGLNSTPSENLGKIGHNEIVVQESNANLTNIQWHNNLYSLQNDDESKQLFEKYSVDIEEATRSTDVYIQQEYLTFDEMVPTSCLSKDSNTALFDIGDSESQEFTHNKGYIKFITTAYALGFYDGGIVYHIDVTTEQQNSFFVNQNDNLIIRHGDNAATLNLEGYETKGERYTPCTIYWETSPNYPSIIDEREILLPNYSCSDSGVYYTFRAGGKTMVEDTCTIVYGNTTVKSDYYLVATDTTEVQPVYVHNYNWFIDSFSVTFGHIGASINAGPMNDVMEGSTMTLKGYDSRIEHETYTMNPEDWMFDGRYYFKNEGLKYSTKTYDNFIIESERLRCGYIEKEYINLSPNRYDAGDAYLELSFSKAIYEFSTYLSFWSKYENLNSTSGDYAYIQYLNKNSVWQTIDDLLLEGLPTDRYKQKHFEHDFIEGTYGIKFVAHKENPDTDKNNGRISIGKTKFVTYEIN